MGQFLGRPGVGKKAKESEKAPAFPDYMLNPDAVVSLSAVMASLGCLEILTDCRWWKGQRQGDLAIWRTSRLHRDQADVGGRYDAAVKLIHCYA